MSDDDVPPGFPEIKKAIDAVSQMLMINYFVETAADFRNIMADFNRFIEPGVCGKEYLLRPGVKVLFIRICNAANSFGGGDDVRAALKELRDFEASRWQH